MLLVTAERGVHRLEMGTGREAQRVDELEDGLVRCRTQDRNRLHERRQSSSEFPGAGMSHLSTSRGSLR